MSESAVATAQVRIDRGYPVTVNHEALTESMLPTLQRVAGHDGVFLSKKITGAEDFSRYQEKIPGLFIFLGITPDTMDLRQAAPNHSAHFMVDEAALPMGVRALAHLASDYAFSCSER